MHDFEINIDNWPQGQLCNRNWHLLLLFNFTTASFHMKLTASVNLIPSSLAVSYLVNKFPGHPVIQLTREHSM